MNPEDYLDQWVSVSVKDAKPWVGRLVAVRETSVSIKPRGQLAWVLNRSRIEGIEPVVEPKA